MQRAPESQLQSPSHCSLQLHLKHRDASCVNEVLCDTSISVNRVFVFEFVCMCLCIGARPKDPAWKRFVVFWDFRETRETREFPSQTRTRWQRGVLPSQSGVPCSHSWRGASDGRGLRWVRPVVVRLWRQYVIEVLVSSVVPPASPHGLVGGFVMVPEPL